MKIKTRLTINFLILTTGILIFFAVSVIAFYLNYRKQIFFENLKNKAVNTAILLINVPEVDKNLLRIIDDNSVSTLSDLCVVVIDKKKELLYSNRDSLSSSLLIKKLSSYDTTDLINITEANILYISIPHSYNGNQYRVLASASDMFGNEDLMALITIILIVFIISISIAILAGYFNAGKSLKPIKNVISQVASISSSNLERRLNLNSNDEISALSKEFNKLLERIEKAFETEKNFISSISHELRTPVTSIKGQLEVALDRSRDEKEYKEVLGSVLEDTIRMAALVNGFLELAEANLEKDKMKKEFVRIEELLFEIKDSYEKLKKGHAVEIEFEKIPEVQDDVTAFCNKRLIYIMLHNLIHNACKFSEDKKANIKIGFSDSKVEIKISDRGIGIPQNEMNEIFKPMYRATNANKPGHGIGLAIAKRIADLHGTKINVISEINVGTIFSIYLPKK